MARQERKSYSNSNLISELECADTLEVIGKHSKHPSQRRKQELGNSSVI